MTDGTQDVTAYGVLMAGVALALHRHGDVVRAPVVESDHRPEDGWRHKIAVAVAISLWLLVWVGGWWIGRTLSSGSLGLTIICAFLGWCIGLGCATLVFYLDERL